MKPMQMIVLLLALTVVVFFVTFASMYVRRAPAHNAANSGNDNEDVLHPTFTAPAKSLGFVRLNWDGKKSGPEILKATLWTQDPVKGETTLQVKAVFTDPFHIDVHERDVGTMAAGDSPRKATFHVLSATRK